MVVTVGDVQMQEPYYPHGGSETIVLCSVVVVIHTVRKLMTSLMAMLMHVAVVIFMEMFRWRAVVSIRPLPRL